MPDLIMDAMTKTKSKTISSFIKTTVKEEAKMKLKHSEAFHFAIYDKIPI